MKHEFLSKRELNYIRYDLDKVFARATIFQQKYLEETYD